MEKQKKEKNGITLIALIITIIVMIILMFVAINVAIQGELFKQTTDAAVGFDEKTVYETIIMCTKYNENGNIVLGETYNNIKNYYGEKLELRVPADESEINESTTNIKIAIQGNREKYKYTISSTGIEQENPLDYSSFNIGDKVLYDGDEDGVKEEWRVMYKDEEKMEICSGLLDSIRIGKNYVDMTGYEAIDYDEDGTVSDVERAIYSTINRIDILNAKCRQQITASDNSGVRNYGCEISSETVIEPVRYQKYNTVLANYPWLEGITFKKYSSDDVVKMGNFVANYMEDGKDFIRGFYWDPTTFNLSDSSLNFRAGMSYRSFIFNKSSCNFYYFDNSSQIVVENGGSAYTRAIVTNPINIEKAE